MPSRYSFDMHAPQGVFGTFTTSYPVDTKFARMDYQRLALERRAEDPSWVEQLVGLVDLDDFGYPE